MKAIVIGATGATGRDLTLSLINNPQYDAVHVFVRHLLEITHPKLQQTLTDFEHLEAIAPAIKGGVVFSCLGTTLKNAGSKEQQYKIDFEYPHRFCELAKANGVHTMVLLSAYGANAKSRVFYSRIKGQLEEAIRALSFEKLIIFQPGLLLRKNSDRAAERLSAKVLRFLNTLGLLKKFRPMPTEVLANSMVKACILYGKGEHQVSLSEIFEV